MLAPARVPFSYRPRTETGQILEDYCTPRIDVEEWEFTVMAHELRCFLRKLVLGELLSHTQSHEQPTKNEHARVARGNA